MKTLLTGGSGYLGSKLAIELTRRGHEVVSVDRQDGDLSVSGVFPRLLEYWQPLDMVVHLAAMPGREFCECEPELAIEQNVTMAMLVARSCGEQRVRLCYVSTSEVYGRTMDHRHLPVHEDAPLRPRNTYALSKLWGEESCRLYAPERLVVLRPSMPYSGDMPVGYGRAFLPTAVERALRSEEIVVHRGTSRSWTFVGDVISGMVTAIERGEGTYNVGDESQEVETYELAKRICEMVDARHEDLVRLEDPPATVSPVKRLSSRRLRELEWRPLVSLDEGLGMTIALLEHRLKYPAST